MSSDMPSTFRSSAWNIYPASSGKPTKKSKSRLITSHRHHTLHSEQPSTPILSSSFSESPLASSSDPASALKARHTPRRKGLPTQISPLATASMGNIEVEVQQIQREHSEAIRRRRTSSFKKVPVGEIEIIPLLEKLPEVLKDVTESLPKLVPRAYLSPGKSAHVKKNSIGDNPTGYGLTVTSKGKTYVHVPKSTFACGGEAEVKLAIDILTKERVVVAKREAFLYTSSKVDDLLAGDKKIMEKCEECKYLAVPYTWTARDRMVAIPGKDGTESRVAKRFFYTISKYYRGGNLDGDVFEGKELLNVAYGLAKGIQRMHREGLVHRDIKPENMYFDEGHPVIADFNTVQSIEDLDTGTVKKLKYFTRNGPGTETYKPPETVKSLHHIDPFQDGPVDRNLYYEQKLTKFERLHPLEFVKRGDIFSLGLSFFQLSRRPSVDGAKGHIRHAELLEASKLFRRMPEPKKGLDRLIYRMLAGNPHDRPCIDEVVAKIKRLKLSMEHSGPASSMS